MSKKNTIQLIVLDVDGVLSKGEIEPFNLTLFEKLATLNRKAWSRGSSPQVTLCTGRPAPYVEAILQAIDGRFPAIFEGGTGIYEPVGYRFYPVPDMGELTSIRNAQKILKLHEERTGSIMIQPGKEYTISVFPTESVDMTRLGDFTREVLGPIADELDFSRSASCLNIQPKGCDKKKGIEYLSILSGISPAEMLGVGDSEVDLSFLSLVGHSASPSNGSGEVKGIVDYISPFPDAEGLFDILRRYRILEDFE